MRTVVLVMIGALLAGQGAAQKPALHLDSPAAAAPEAVSPPPEGQAPPAPPAEGRTFKWKVSQLMFATMQGVHAPNADDLGFLRSYTPGGVVLQQILQPAQAVIYIAKLRGVETLSGVPLLIGGDLYEFTQRDRGAPSAFVDLPPLLSVAAAANPDMTARLARFLAAHMQAMGFNLYLGPPLDLAPTLPEAHGSIHCLGGNPDFVADTADTFLSTFSEYGLLAMPMGFPGGGLNRTPPGAAVLLTPKALLGESDLKPYVRAIARGVSILHVGNTLAPTLDTLSRPASQSRAVMQDLLRGELGFQGVIVAGPVDSEDMAAAYDPAEAAIEALRSGADMIYWRSPANTVMRAVDRIEHAVAQGELDAETIEAALKRVLALKQKLGQMTRPEVKESNAEALRKKGDLVRESADIQRHAITLVQNRGAVLPLDKKVSMPLGVTGVVGVEILQKALEKHLKPVSAQVITTARHLGEIQEFEIERITSRIRNFRTVVCIFTNSMRPEGQAKLVRELKLLGAQVVVLLLGYPRNLPQLAGADAILLGYCDPASAGQTLIAMADILVGQAPACIMAATADAEMRAGEKRIFDASALVRVPAGALPVSVSEAYPAGLGLSYALPLTGKKVEWDFGTGTRVKDLRTEYVFTAPGRYPVKLTVTGKHGDAVSRTFNVVVHE
jgi:beta-N-acetylhexosaminidase